MELWGLKRQHGGGSQTMHLLYFCHQHLLQSPGSSAGRTGVRASLLNAGPCSLPVVQTQQWQSGPGTTSCTWPDHKHGTELKNRIFYFLYLNKHRAVVYSLPSLPAVKFSWDKKKIFPMNPGLSDISNMNANAKYHIKYKGFSDMCCCCGSGFLWFTAAGFSDWGP